MTTRFYVSLTWHDWPEGGSFGTVVEAEGYQEAEDLARREMAANQVRDHQLCWHCGGDTNNHPEGLCDSCLEISQDQKLEPTNAGLEQTLAEYNDHWHLVDCFKVDDFIKRHTE